MHMARLLSTNEMNVAFTPERGKKIARTNMPTIGPDIAPITATHI